jgi:hypothetical protein
MSPCGAIPVAWHAASVLETWDQGPGLRYGCRLGPPRWPAAGSTLEEERQDLFEAILDGLRRYDTSRHHAAACRYLLLHLLTS